MQLVLHLDLGDVGVGALLEGHDDGHAAVGAAFSRHVAEAVEPAELLLDDLHYGVLHRLCRGAGVGHGDGNGRRGDVRVLAYGHLHQRQRPGEHGDNRQHPGEDRPVDKETRHELLAPQLAAAVVVAGANSETNLTFVASTGLTLMPLRAR